MPEGLFNSDETRIHDFVVEGPRAEKGLFRIEDEISEDELARWLEICWERMRNSTRNGHLDLHRIDIDNTACVKLLVPDAMNSRFQAIDHNRTPNEIAATSIKNYLIHSMTESERTGGWHELFQKIFLGISLSPQAVDFIRDRVLTDYRESALAYLAGKVLDADDLDFGFHISTLVGIKLLLPEYYERLHGDEAFRPAVKKELESAYQNEQWGKYRGIAAGAAILFRNEPFDIHLDVKAWEGMVDYLDEARSMPSDWTVMVNCAAQMKLLAAEQIIINEEGVTIIDRQAKSDLSASSPLPESRSF
jgi:hypothetical protein